MSPENQVKMVSDFMNEEQKKATSEELDEVGSVTVEEMRSVVREKESAAKLAVCSAEELRVLQGIYDSCIAPVIALIPLGTGNDLSRCLGTGFAYPGTRQLLTRLVPAYRTAPITKLDRWRIEFRDKQGRLRTRQTSELLCYFSVGFEGQIALKFDQARASNPRLFDRPWKNKLQYMLSGIGAGVQEALGVTKPLNDDVEVFVDGERLKLPSNARSVVVSNIQVWPFPANR